MRVENEAGDRELTLVDTVGVIVALAAVAALFAMQRYSTSILGALLKDVGSPETMPLVTRVTLSPVFSSAIASVSIAMLIIGFVQRSARVRRLLLLAVFGIVALAFVTTLVGWYLPIFAIADAIKAD